MFNKSSLCSIKLGEKIGSGDLHIEVLSSEKKRFNWARFSWEGSRKEECAVCLEGFKVGEVLVNMPCSHTFHFNCLVPWLQAHSVCPCCRTHVPFKDTHI
ncbi:hypothetical protein AMTR_s00026p00191500 [Amborella trichopoda]|uniref:RING-type domain-containing protein n=1 Tax=Amborella trichopoda TaxID=13333 RepID=W1PRS8_AMBTC|nr:hypothetical protein AMTR_s00026p00191500 [Amborella trichopoda]